MVYDFIVSYAKKHGIAPSLEEIANNFSEFMAHPSSAQYHVNNLQKLGYLEKQSNRPRSIEINENKIVKTPFLTQKGLSAVRVPILGSANAGPAMLVAEENITGYLKVSSNILGKKKDHVFALWVEGDSMNKAKIGGKSIETGDFVLIDPTHRNPTSGDYVLSVIDGYANIKKFQKNQTSGQISLVSESSNDKYKPIYVSSEDDFLVNGKIIDVIKK